MSNADKLKRKAAEFEQKKQYDRALELYVQVLDSERGTPEERDVPLYNRVGDLHMRLGNAEKAVSYYEKAVDLYSEGGYLNNAIALCNKILRHAPARNTIYYKLGKISAKKGFNSDAKQNFLEYADRMQKLGQMDEAFRALQEFADLCPGQDDIRLLLAEQLSRAGRKDEALEQLQILHEALDADGRAQEAVATVERMRAIDPAVTPRRAAGPRSVKTGGLVFLDLADAPPADSSPVEGLETTSLADEASTRGASAAPAPKAVPDVPGLEHTALEDDAVDPLAGLPLVSDEEPEPLETERPRKKRSDDDYVNLADWLAEDDGREGRSTRMVASDEKRAVEGQADFAEMLAKFKEGVAANLEEGDASSHYDLGVAYREMGLLDEAISEFQTALRGTDSRIRAYEAMGQCFIDKGDAEVAVTVLSSALSEADAGDEQLVGVLYLLGVASESLGLPEDASAYYQRVVAVDIDFRDVGQRMLAVGRGSR